MTSDHQTRVTCHLHLVCVFREGIRSRVPLPSMFCLTSAASSAPHKKRKIFTIFQSVGSKDKDHEVAMMLPKII